MYYISCPKLLISCKYITALNLVVFEKTKLCGSLASTTICLNLIIKLET